MYYEVILYCCSWGAVSIGSLIGATVMIVVNFELMDPVHDLDGTTQLESQALDQGLMGEEEESDTVHFLTVKQIHVALAV